MKPLAFILAAVTFGSLPLLAETPPAPQPPQQRPAPRQMPGSNNLRQQIMQRQKERLTVATAEILKRYDKNNDGKLDEAERAVMLKEFADAQLIARLARDFALIEKIDTDKDLKLSDDELKAYEQRVISNVPPRGSRNFGRPNFPPPPPSKPAAK